MSTILPKVRSEPKTQANLSQHVKEWLNEWQSWSKKHERQSAMNNAHSQLRRMRNSSSVVKHSIWRAYVWHRFAPTCSEWTDTLTSKLNDYSPAPPPNSSSSQGSYMSLAAEHCIMFSDTDAVWPCKISCEAGSSSYDKFQISSNTMLWKWL